MINDYTGKTIKVSKDSKINYYKDTNRIFYIGEVGEYDRIVKDLLKRLNTMNLSKVTINDLVIFVESDKKDFIGGIDIQQYFDCNIGVIDIHIVKNYILNSLLKSINTDYIFGVEFYYIIQNDKLNISNDFLKVLHKKSKKLFKQISKKNRKQ